MTDRLLHPFVTRRTLLQAAALAPFAAALPGALKAAPPSGFTHSVASGDPLQDSVTLWTRYEPAGGGPAELRIELSLDTTFDRVVARGAAQASAEHGFCAKARIEGLEPGRWYYYRFIAPDGQVSDTGRTRTLPEGPLDHFRIGVFSCANATSGWFNAYGHAAARNDLDLVVHLGDYIYESKLTRSDALKKLAVSRNIQPQHEAVSLLDYRLRYASYRLDADLQALHRAYPMIAMCDDHETVNNSWQHGAENHGADEGPWDIRKGAAMQAWHEWMPMRSDPYTRYELGDLASLFRLETRTLARSKQLDLGGWLKDKPDPVAAAAAFRDGPLADPARTMMGVVQEQWLADGLASSVTAGTKWQILAQQVIMGTTIMPRDYRTWFPPDAPAGGQQKTDLDLAVKLGAMGIPTSMDRWDGYPAARARVLAAAQSAQANLVVLSGDSHNAWAFDLENAGQPAGVEFAGQSVSSLGIDKRYFGNPADIARSYLDANPALKWCDTSRRGYMVVDVRPEAVTNEWLFLHSRHQHSLEVLDSQRMHVLHGASRLQAG
ncbi:alkaline phosphatase D family protein [Novosphingobium album (ex Hu et al. 2023)]|uniref:Alkaline phosphatase D family protein n=1 Tax=Novosphingobium album (ex Hu et al. 2023) TaxID=2930093 RepID=A0ABT0B0J7_9SPHN|nr:alkaline phosphatase D family protein [Novosphingobium album (ex Hu et al. 2023)]MCJ2178413.1 alkaline phosphatase D family protein [Novosphingobium album (ex Hu et al. 2023)]